MEEEASEMLVSIVGTRPNLIKLAPIVRAARKDNLEHHIIHTGQHYDYELSQVFFEELELPPPDTYLKVGSGSDGYQIGETIHRVTKTLQRLKKPAFILVYGDTNATAGAALGARKCGFKVGHIESGIRTGDYLFPEEINRVISETCSDVLFAPTKSTYENVRSTGRAVLSGDCMFDTLLWAEPRLDQKLLSEFDLTPREYCLVTMHRGMNVDKPSILRRILKALEDTGEHFLFPVHPRTKKTLEKLQVPSSIQVTPPLGYFAFLSLMKYSKKVITDSGGAQKEAYAFGIPSVILLHVPVWQELVEVGWNLPVSNEPDKIRQAILEFWPRGKRPPIFGDGRAGDKILQTLHQEYDKLLSG